MGSRGPLQQDQRQRPRDTVAREELVKDDVVRGFPLPEATIFDDTGRAVAWHPMVERWWEAFRRSPMAQRVTEDVQWETLLAAMVVYNDAWWGGSRGRAMRITEFRAFFASYFITPGDLRRNGLEVVVPTGEEDDEGLAATGTDGNVTSLDDRRARLTDE
ncbi:MULTISPECIES: hypothetical protein [unclassified Aeromicrobium]|uniref:phage terminase small subunit n=1 Tax=unclassified Aeromicrobium TaxID=2633570 RepID=UPI0028890A92|nr:MULTISPECIES: hypothetical protein [unclassified Aeromicrobium]